jgi:hypothetical protein
MNLDRMQTQRFERKYFIKEPQVAPLREFISGYLQLDEFSLGRPDNCYPIHSIYLDSDQLTTYWATVHCEKLRFKLRARYYSDDPDGPVFFEIKRRENECVLKQRAPACRKTAGQLIGGQMPGAEHLISDRPYDLAVLQRFCYWSHRLHARPMMQISYEREAWIHPQTNSVRVTMDRNVRGEPRHEAIFKGGMDHPVFPFRNQIVLELKYTDRFPEWFGALVRRFDLVQIGAPKYCATIYETGEQRVVSKFSHQTQQRLAQAAAI